ncbi:fatty-acid--CoA ligase FadD4 [Acrocarpospora macrocephala]|uniref:Acyl-CoA synthetase n=1 Tax=Acrocarpospora macrocephala TaxID=150177 RepID=A0A5M3X2D5_9ACTN|nr:AMP-binding protein [Acrocarpospora macrocephala]GES15907.1 acyl-CoA synthetase [Acrocarpospora macrocephala]
MTASTDAGAREARGFYEIAAADPRRAAIHVDGAVVTYGDLLGRVNQWSHLLSGPRGVSRGGTIAVVLPNSLDFVVAQLAVEQTGLRMVPVNWHLTAAEIAYLLDDSGSGLVITDPRHAHVVGEAAAEVGIAGDALLLTGRPDTGIALEALLAEQPVAMPSGRHAGSMLFYSSGTSGRPKGVRRPFPTSTPDEAADARSRQRSAQFGMGEEHQVHLAVAPLYHPGPNLNALSALHLGQELVLRPRFDPREILELIDAHRVTSTFMVPVMFHRMLELPEADRARFDGSSLEVVMHAGAPCPVEVKHKMIRWWGPVLTEYYGCTEFGMATLVTSQVWLDKPGSVGRAADGISLQIRDDHGVSLPPGEIGTIWVRGGYEFAYSGAAVSAASDQEGPADGFRTAGDVGYLDEDGFLYVGDRRADLILSGGVNIYPAEVEAALVTEPTVADAVVVGVPDTEWGQRVVAVVELKPGEEAGEEAVERLRRHLAPRLARFKSPREYRFVDSVHRTSLGKVNRTRILDEVLLPTTAKAGPASDAAALTRRVLCRGGSRTDREEPR